MPIPGEYVEIIGALTQKTSVGAVAWEKSKYDVSVEVDGSKFSLWAGTDEHSDEPFVALSLKDVHGVILDSWFLDASDTDYKEVYQLYKSANRHALGVPARLKELTNRIVNMK